MTSALSLHVVRPYLNEEEFLEAEAWTVNSRSLLLVGVEFHPEGTIARVELSLSSGKSLIVAEGSVVKHLAATSTRPAGLVVRFRRMSAASSDFVKRAVGFSAERPAASSPLASIASVVQQPPPNRPTRASSPPGPADAVPKRGASTSKPPARRGSIAPRDRLQSQPPPQDRALNRASNRAPATLQASSRPSAPPRAGSVSVIPAAKRVSTVPPVASDQTAIRSVRPAPLPPASDELKKLRLEHLPEGFAPGQRNENVAPPKVVDEGAHHDTGAIDRLRKRQAGKPITVPPDREAILARLKKPQ